MVWAPLDRGAKSGAHTTQSPANRGVSPNCAGGWPSPPADTHCNAYYPADVQLNSAVPNPRFETFVLTLNQRVQGSSPCAPTNEINELQNYALGTASQKSRLGSTREATTGFFRRCARRSLTLNRLQCPRLICATDCCSLAIGRRFLSTAILSTRKRVRSQFFSGNCARLTARGSSPPQISQKN
jgi:hypothetical protein